MVYVRSQVIVGFSGDRPTGDGHVFQKVGVTTQHVNDEVDHPSSVSSASWYSFASISRVMVTLRLLMVLPPMPQARVPGEGMSGLEYRNA